eukprot:40930-Eustigmatos_ZCMA.PRE.1
MCGCGHAVGGWCEGGARVVVVGDVFVPRDVMRVVACERVRCVVIAAGAGAAAVVDFNVVGCVDAAVVPLGAAGGGD